MKSLNEMSLEELQDLAKRQRETVNNWKGDSASWAMALDASGYNRTMEEINHRQSQLSPA